MHIGLDLTRLHRFEVMRRDHALAQLFELVGTGEQALEFRLAEQKRLQERMRAELEVRQHPQFLERADREVLRFVDDQQTAFAVARFLVEEMLDRGECCRLVTPFDIEAETACGDMDHLLAIERAGDDFAHAHPVVELLLEMRDQRRFARADLAGDDHEAFALVQAVTQIGQRLLVRDALEEIGRVGRELEGPL